MAAFDPPGDSGIIVTPGEIVTTVVNPDYLNLDSGSPIEVFGLFDTDEDEIDIDVYFIKTIDQPQGQACGLTSGVTSSPTNSGPVAEVGIAIADTVCDGTGAGQEVVRTLAHEITHYLLNHADGEADHVPSPENPMSPTTSNSKRDLDQNQSLDLLIRVFLIERASLGRYAHV